MNSAKIQFELGPDGSLQTMQSMDESCLPLLRNALRVRRTSGASLLRVR